MDTNSTETDDDKAEEGTTDGTRMRTWWTAGGALVIAVAALAASLVYTVHTFGETAPVSAGADRDSAVAAARTIGSTMTTVKGGDPDATLSAWQGVITGPLADQFTQQAPQLTQGIQKNQNSVSSKVTNAALSEFDHSAGKAVALVFVDTTLIGPEDGAPPSAAPSPSAATPSPDGQAAPGIVRPQSQRLALTISLLRTGQEWKAADLKPVDPTKVGQ